MIFFPIIIFTVGLELLCFLAIVIYNSVALTFWLTVSLIRFITVYLFSIPFSVYIPDVVWVCLTHITFNEWLFVFFILIKSKVYYLAFVCWPTVLLDLLVDQVYRQCCSLILIPILKILTSSPITVDFTSWKFWVVLFFFDGIADYVNYWMLSLCLLIVECLEFAVFNIFGVIVVYFLKVLFFPIIIFTVGLELLCFLAIVIYNSVALTFWLTVSLIRFITVYLFSIPFSVYPELILVLAIFVAVGCFAYARTKYNVSFFYKQLITVFGYRAVLKISNLGSYEHNMLLRFHNSRRQLTAAIYAWRVLVLGVMFSLWWFVKQFGFVYSVSARNSMRMPSIPLVEPVVVGHSDAWFGMHFYHDSFTFGSRLFILFLFILFLIIVRNEIFNESRLTNIEFLILYTFGTIFCMLMVSSFSLISLFLSAEGLVMTMYLLTASGIYYKLFSKYIGTELSGLVRYRSLEGALKYSFFNILSTFFLLFGSLLLFVFTKASFFFSTIAVVLGNLSVSPFSWTTGSPSILLLLGLFFGLLCLCLSFFFKLGLFPFSSWVADLYDSTLPINLVYFLIIPKAAVMLGFVNLYRFLFVHFHVSFFIICFVFGLISIIFGSLNALNQQRIARVLAYSSVTYAGMFVLLTAICFLPLVKLPHLAVVFVIAYICVLLFFLTIYMALRYSPYYFTYAYINQFRVAHTRSKLFQVLLVKALFSLSGVPPLLGWVLKFVFLIALVKLFSFALFDFYRISSLIPIDLFVGFFQQYDIYQVATGSYLLEKSLYEQLTNISASGSQNTCVIGGLPGKVISLPTTTTTETVFFNQSAIQYAKALKTDIGTTCYNIKILLLDGIRALFVGPAAGVLTDTAVEAESQIFSVESLSRFFLLNETGVFLGFLKSSTWFVTIFFSLLFILFLVTVISTFYYLRILKSIYAAPKHAFLYFNQNTGSINVSFSLTALICFLAIVNVLGLFYFQIFNTWVFLVFCVNAIGF